MEGLIRQAAIRIARSTRVVVSTGAGISKESGIPTFRESDGLWNDYRPEELATREGFLSNPRLVWKWYRERLMTARDHEPNPGHFALTRLESLIPRLVVVTQNVDNLHRRAGTSRLVELHGSIEQFRCLDNSHYTGWDENWGDEPPLCHCGSMIRPDVVWFGEPLPQVQLEAAFNESGTCDVFIVVGTSGLVQPAARLPHVASRAGATIIEINIEESAVSALSDIFLRGRSGEILPLIVERVEDILGS